MTAKECAKESMSFWGKEERRLAIEQGDFIEVEVEEDGEKKTVKIGLTGVIADGFWGTR